MSQRMRFALVGSLVSIASGTMCMWTLSLTSNLARIAGSLLVQMPSLLLIGLVVGVMAERLQAGLLAAVVGAAIGWIIGSLVSAYIFLPPGLRVEQISALFYVAQILVGTLAGLLPVMISYLLKTYKH